MKKLNATETFISAEEAALIATFRQISLRARETKPPKDCRHQDAVYPGKPWLDTCGRRIQAHGGAVYFEDGVYYWYGENKEYTYGKNGAWTWGIRAYASTDLCNWEDKGLIRRFCNIICLTEQENAETMVADERNDEMDFILFKQVTREDNFINYHYDLAGM